MAGVFRHLLAAHLSRGEKAGLTDAEAQDIVQETVVAMANKLPGFIYDPKVCSFKTWMLRLITIAPGDCCSRLRSTSGVSVAFGHSPPATRIGPL